MLLPPLIRKPQQCRLSFNQTGQHQQQKLTHLQQSMQLLLLLIWQVSP